MSRPPRPLFVYGTLKSGFGNHTAYLYECRCLGKALTMDKFDMLDIGFPVLLPQQNEEAYRVLGEVYEIGPSQAIRVDQLESNGRMYLRQPRSVKLVESGKIMLADVYIGVPGIWSEAQAATPRLWAGFDGKQEVYDWEYTDRTFRKRNVMPR